MHTFKKIILILLLLLGIMAAFIGYRTVTFPSRQLTASSPVKPVQVTGAVDRFSEAIRIRTVSPENKQDFDSVQFDRFSEFLSRTYPLMDSLLEKRTFQGYSHLYRWPGSDPALQPGVLMGHFDVVPVIEENRKYWKADPFGGEVRNDTIWGRGTIDDKVGVLSILESVEYLLANGHQPKRTLYIALGHDEEIGGLGGARNIADYLQAQGVKAEFVLDEGGFVSSGMIPGVEKEVALIGIAEKGFASMYLSVEIEGGHSSMPGRETAIDIMSGAIARLKANRLPAGLSAPMEEFMDFIGPEMPFLQKMAMANREIFTPLILKAYEESSSGNALVRTTTAPTIFRSGVKDNIIPFSAEATVNFRVLPGSGIQEVLEHIEEVVADDRIKVRQGEYNCEPSSVAPVNGLGFQTLQSTIGQLFPDALVAPYLVVGGTDSRHFSKVSDAIYRFSPVRLSSANIKSFHGLNERLAVSDLQNSIGFYIQFIRNLDAVE